MQDVQGWQDRRQVSVQRAGVKGVELPWRIRQQDGQVQTVLAAVTLSVDLSHEARGTHMSRFLEVLERWQEQPHAGAALEDILTEVRRRLHATSASMDVRFRYFLPKAAPVTGQRSTMGYPCMLSGSLAGD